MYRYVFVVAPDGSHSAPDATCAPLSRKMHSSYSAPIAKCTHSCQNVHVFVSAPDDSHSAPDAKCVPLSRKTYDFKIMLAVAPNGSHRGSHLNQRKPQAKHLLLLTAPTLIYITK